MLLLSLPPPPAAPLAFTSSAAACRRRILRLRPVAAVPSAAADALRVLEWGKVCDAVAAFAGTALGRNEVKRLLQEVVDVEYEDSQRLLSETVAAVEFIKHGASGLDFGGVDTALVKSAVDCVSRGALLEGQQAMAVVGLILIFETLQTDLKGAIKEDSDWYNRFMPLTELILEASISLPFVKAVQKVIDEDGTVKDNASSELKNAREQVRNLERRLYQLVDKLKRIDKNCDSLMEVCFVNGRCCIKVTGSQNHSIDGLLLASSSATGNTLEPIAAVSLNDELLQARASALKAEENVLSMLTSKMVPELEIIKLLLQIALKLDAVAARAKFSIELGGTFPEICLPEEKVARSSSEKMKAVEISHLSKKKWKLYMPKAYHPLLLQRYRDRLLAARKAVANASSEIRRRAIYGRSMVDNDALMPDLESMKLRVSQVEEGHPTPVDFMIDGNINVVVITGPNTGGKTISLKTVGLASLMAKVGLFVIASEPVVIPWFDAVYADIGDEQSLTQSLSTFSGHLKQIGAIRASSTSSSLVLLDEVGAGTNPLEGSALGMSLLESFAESGTLLTLATTHHGELKTLKYSNSVFENACVEFDDEKLKPTFRILWGVPGRSNAINIAERLGLPPDILERAKKLHGTASAEINGIIVDMERFKQECQQNLQEAQHYITLSKNLRKSLLASQLKIEEHKKSQKSRKAREISEYAVIARSILRNKMKQLRECAHPEPPQEIVRAQEDTCKLPNLEKQHTASPPSAVLKSQEDIAEEQDRVPGVGDLVHVCTLNKQATVLNIDHSKGEVLVQAGILKLRVKLKDVRSQQGRRVSQR